MEKVKRRKLVILVLSLAALVAFPPLAIAAGSLEPSAPPGPVMKSLDEVEPRIPIKASDFPLTITQRGSYYLTQDINFTDTAHHAITVGCNDVTIDLKGYTITGPNSIGYYGIYMNGRTNVEICNGTVRYFYRGVYESSTNGRGHQVINIRAISNRNEGISLHSQNNIVKDCTATENGIWGIIADSSTVTGNTASYNGSYGIFVGSGCTVTGNTASLNSGLGIYAAFDCTVTGNTSSYNSTCGIYADSGCTVTGNTVGHNTQDGIRCYEKNLVTDNTCFSNGNNGDGAGIHAISFGNRIEGNHVSANDRGIEVDSYPNLIVRNSATGNTAEYDVVAGNKIAAVSTDPNTAGPWANFDF